MAQVAFGSNLGQQRGSQHDYVIKPVSLTVPAVVSTTAVAAAIAVLVADGASPTQAHVTTLNGAWATLLAAINTSVVGASDIAVTIDNTQFTTKNQVRVALRHLLYQAENSSAFTA